MYALLLHRVEEIRGSDIGTRAGLFEVLKLGDEFFTFIVDCEDPKACTILLRGASKDVLNEVRPMAWRAPSLSFQHNSVRHPGMWYLASHRAYSDRIQQAGPWCRAPPGAARPARCSVHAELCDRASWAGVRSGNQRDLSRFHGTFANCMRRARLRHPMDNFAAQAPRLCEHGSLSQGARVQVERNLHDAMGVARNVMMDPRLVPGGGAVEMAVSRGLSDRAAAVVGPEQVSHEPCPAGECVILAAQLSACTMHILTSAFFREV